MSAGPKPDAARQGGRPRVLTGVLRRWLPLLLLLLGPAWARADDGPEVARLRAEMELRARVAPAVERAAAWLWTLQREDGSLFLAPELRREDLPKEMREGLPDGFLQAAPTHVFGKSALAALALTHAGAKADDPRLVRALDHLRRHYREVMTRGYAMQAATYSMALVLMALHDYYRLPDAPVDTKANPRSNPMGLAAHDLAIVRLVGRWFLRTRSGSGLFSYPYPPVRTARRRGRAPDTVDPRDVWDMSNTQYALLGLWAATRCGFQVSRGTLEEIAEALLAAQTPEGAPVVRHLDPPPGAEPGTGTVTAARDRARGFGYTSLQGPMAASWISGSMTAGGLSSTLIVKALLEEQEALDPRLGKRLEHAIWDAIGWLAEHYRIDANPGAIETAHLPKEQAEAMGKAMQGAEAPWHYYYLYGLERALVIAGKRYLGAHDWWLEGTRLLLDAQGEDGSWRLATPGVLSMTESRLVETCFAVLFLRRATLRPRAPLIDVHAPAEAK